MRSQPLAKTKVSKTAPTSLGYPSMPGFPRHTRGLGASRRKVAAAFCAQPTLDPDIIAAEIVEDLQAALSQFAEIANDLKR